VLLEIAGPTLIIVRMLGVEQVLLHPALGHVTGGHAFILG
jgi:hypothetical protein